MHGRPVTRPVNTAHTTHFRSAIYPTCKCRPLSRLEIGKWKLESGKWTSEMRSGMAPLGHGKTESSVLKIYVHLHMCGCK